jgi:hypothetical protein
VAVIGYPNHGKTVFLAGLFWDSFFALAESFQHQEQPYAIRAVNQKASEVFFGNAITLSRGELPPSSPRTPPEPAVIEVTGVPGLDGKRRNLRLTFYDIPGEAVSDEAWLLRNAPFLPRITDVLFVFDPTRRDFTARALQAADLWDRISRLVPRSEQKNLMVALSKMDELRYENEWANTLAEYWPDASPTPAGLRTYVSQMDALSHHLRAWWLDRAHGGPGFVNRVHRNARFCALSSLGQQPVWECAECQGVVPDAATKCKGCGAARDRTAPLRLASLPQPFRVRDPLFWIFRSAGVM